MDEVTELFIRKPDEINYKKFYNSRTTTMN